MWQGTNTQPIYASLSNCQVVGGGFGSYGPTKFENCTAENTTRGWVIYKGEGSAWYGAPDLRGCSVANPNGSACAIIQNYDSQPLILRDSVRFSGTGYGYFSTSAGVGVLPVLARAQSLAPISNGSNEVSVFSSYGFNFGTTTIPNWLWSQSSIVVENQGQIIATGTDQVTFRLKFNGSTNQTMIMTPPSGTNAYKVTWTIQPRIGQNYYDGMGVVTCGTSSGSTFVFATSPTLPVYIDASTQSSGTSTSVNGGMSTITVQPNAALNY
jgi:hypothetical protein